MEFFSIIFPLLVVSSWAYIAYGFVVCPQGMYDTYKEKTKPPTPMLTRLWYGIGVIIFWPYFWWKYRREIQSNAD